MLLMSILDSRLPSLVLMSPLQLSFKCLTSLFSLLGMPAYVHSDQGATFMNQELREFLTSKGVATSHTTSYNPTCKGQVKKYNGTVWRGITMRLKSKNLKTEQWQLVLPDVLHSIPSLPVSYTHLTLPTNREV